MDEELKKLARAAKADPADEAAARHLDAALHRAGRDAEVADRFRFKFQCPKSWSDLEARAFGVRFCESCQREVHWVHDAASLTAEVKRGNCVAFAESALGQAFQGLSRAPGLHSAKETRSPCVVSGGKAPPATPSAVRDLMPGHMVHAFRAAPMTRRAGRLVVAAAEDLPAFAVAQIARESGLEVEVVLVTGAEIEVLLRSYPDEAEDVLMGAIACHEDPMPDEAREHRANHDFAKAALAMGKRIKERDRLSVDDVRQLCLARCHALALAGGAAHAAAARRELGLVVRAHRGWPDPALWLAALFDDRDHLEAHAAATNWTARLVRCLRRETTTKSLLSSIRADPDAQARREHLAQTFALLGASLETRGAGKEAQECYRSCVEQAQPESHEREWASARLAVGGPAPWIG
ncbi:MAG TPA: hypothetical protein VFF73_20945 [Planctomycetota bacterium]|nr:hypothetical protein [Planctomycetota bacterium]